MIGQMPRWRPQSRRRRTLPYTIPRRARKGIAKQAREPRSVDTGRMLFDASSELPRAEVIREPASFIELIATGIAQWFRARMRWVRPRMIPLLVAAAGLGLTIEAVNQLSRPPERTESSISASSTWTYQPGRIRIVLQQ